MSAVIRTPEPISTCMPVALPTPGAPPEAASAMAPVAVRTPEPYRPDGRSATPHALEPGRQMAPSLALRTPEPLTHRAAATTTAVAGAGVSQVINVTVPAPADGSDDDVVVRLDAVPSEGRVELHVRRQSGGEMPVTEATPRLPSATPRPAPTPRVVAPTVPRSPVAPVERSVAATLAVPFIAESYPAGALDVPFSPVPRLGLQGWWPLGADWTLDGHVGTMRYTVVDQQYTPSRHQRQEVVGGLTAWRRLSPDWQAGVGYWGRALTVTHTQPPPLTVPLLTSPFQAFHGPQLSGRTELALLPGWTLGAEVSARPFLFAQGDEAVMPLGPGWGFGAATEVGYRLDDRWSATFALTYNRQGAWGAGYVRSELGPSARAAWRF